MHGLFISQNPENHVKKPYTQKWISILNSTLTGSLSNRDAVTIWGISLNGRCGPQRWRLSPVSLAFSVSLPPRPWASGAPLGVLWLSGGGGLEAVATRSRSNNGTQHLLFSPFVLKNDNRPANELKQIRSRASWESLVLNRLGSLTNACISSFLRWSEVVQLSPTLQPHGL